MYIVTKLYVEMNKTEIIDVVENLNDVSYMVAYEALLEDVLKYPVMSNSIKSVSKDRIEVYMRTYFGNYLRFVYQIHDTGLKAMEDDDKTEE